ncbi:MAG: hypothetical protein HYV45_01490 [Candidatus Moranbacteria bacterium]|nr:hypothetical protein [Candidatus Moranbacteria bacterium]
MSKEEKASMRKNLPNKGFFVSAIEDLLGDISPRSLAIVEARFGIGGERPKTLEEIGKFYQITRERVRQVVVSVMGFLSHQSTRPVFEEAASRVRVLLEKNDGIVKSEILLETLASGSAAEHGALLAFLASFSFLEESKETRECETVFFLKGFSFDDWKKVKNEAKEILESAGTTLDENVLYRLFKEKNKMIEKEKFFHFLSVSKEIRPNVFGKWGLSNWSDIKPRGTREKAHLILKMTKKPLHFREISLLIDTYGLQGAKKKKSHPQTVHNELIKDERFILVGRGIYALAEWGYTRGTVKEVLEDIFKHSEKPLSREEVLVEILKIRQVKKSTVIINLNTFFHRVDKDMYTLKK